MSDIKGKSSWLSVEKKEPESKHEPQKKQEYFFDSYGNRYVSHAVSGMQPSGNRYHDAGIIYYFDSSGKKVDGNSIPAMCVDNCLKNSKPTITTRGDEQRKVYLYDGIEVVTLMDGTIITVTRKD